MPDPRQASWLRATVGSKGSELKFKKGTGCPNCHNTGYQGRIGIFELLEIDHALADALRRNDNAAFANVARQQKGFQPLALCALKYAAEGTTSLDEVLRIAGQVDEFETADEQVAAN